MFLFINGDMTTNIQEFTSHIFLKIFLTCLEFLIFFSFVFFFVPTFYQQPRRVKSNV